VAYFDKARAVLEAINDAEGASDAIKGLALVKSMFEGDNSELLLKGLALFKSFVDGGKETLKAAQEEYELCIVQNAEDEVMIKAGAKYALLLFKANHNTEAIELMTKVQATYEQLHGSQPEDSRRFNQLLQIIKLSC
jgi:hypothetical protein